MTQVEQVILEKKDIQAINGAFSGMPYGAICHFQSIRTPADIVANLHKLKDVLGSVSTDSTNTKAELADLQRMVGEVRRFFGVKEQP